ncbi:thiamine phosphate synthase [Salinicola aestuarinus]|uniref:thiamine phosphate synthase n=1 Tax=Salinicola aestuarinus TaxID=1949082 RepID=UPI000DA19479|nr:thiamine phosphate synthase [Salinicola aestuarinus]
MSDRSAGHALNGLYAITDSGLLSEDSRLLDACGQALEAGIALLQYRDKSDDTARRRRQTEALASLCARHATPLIINDDLALAEWLRARWGEGVGLHLGQGDGSLALARARLGDDAIIGATCHGSLALAERAAGEGASYLAFGRFFPSRTKPAAVPASLTILAEAARFGLPRVAIGGIDGETAGQAREAGAELLAVVHALFAADDVHGATRELDAAMRAASLPNSVTERC